MLTARRLSLFVAVPAVLVACATDFGDGGEQTVPDVENGAAETTLKVGDHIDSSIMASITEADLK